MTHNWYPKIDYRKCEGDLICVSFCPHGVYKVEGGKPKVVDAEACVEFCRGCQKICPSQAIDYVGDDA